MTRLLPLLLAALLLGGPAQAFEDLPVPEGRPVEIVPDRAAAVAGNAAAQYRVGIYFLDRYVDSGREPYGWEAFKWLFASAEQGYGSAQYVLARLVRPEDRRISAPALRARAGALLLPAKEHALIGRYLLTGARGNEPEAGKDALNQLEVAALAGDQEATLLLARVYARIDPPKWDLRVLEPLRRVAGSL